MEQTYTLTNSNAYIIFDKEKNLVNDSNYFFLDENKIVKLAPNWKVKSDNKYWLVLESTVDYTQITFAKQSNYYRVERTEELEEYNEDSTTTFISFEEHFMITDILRAIHNL